MKFLFFGRPMLPVIVALCCGAGAWHPAATGSTSSAATSASPDTLKPDLGLDLRAALESAWRRSVAFREAAGQHEQAVADRAMAASPWSAPPALEVSRREDRQSATGARETEIGLAIPLWWPGQRAALAQRTETAVALAAAAEAAERLRLAGSLRELVWEWAQGRAEAALADAQVQALCALAEDVDRRVQAGDLARTDGMAARAECLTAQAGRTETQRRLQAIQARWAVATGHSSPAIGPPAPQHLALRPGVAAGHTHPEAMRAQWVREVAEQSLKVVRSATADAPEVSLSMRQDSTAHPASAPHSLALGLRIPLGPESRNRPRLASAQAALSIAQIQQERLNERLAREAITADEGWTAAQAQFESLSQAAALLRERAQWMERAFKVGEVELPELLRALASAGAAEAAAARQLAAWGLARARLEQALGILP